MTLQIGIHAKVQPGNKSKRTFTFVYGKETILTRVRASIAIKQWSKNRRRMFEHDRSVHGSQPEMNELSREALRAKTHRRKQVGDVVTFAV